MRRFSGGDQHDSNGYRPELLLPFLSGALVLSIEVWQNGMAMGIAVFLTGLMILGLVLIGMTLYSMTGSPSKPARKVLSGCARPAPFMKVGSSAHIVTIQRAAHTASCNLDGTAVIRFAFS